MKIFVFMCDDRMNSLADRLQEEGYEVFRIKEQKQIEELLLQLSSFDAGVLPIHGVEEEGKIRMEGKILEGGILFQNLRKDCLLYSGVSTPYLEKLTQKKVYLFAQEEIMKKNAVLTAEGLLHQMIEHTRESIFDCRIQILGTGHVAKTLGDMLARLTIHVTLVRTREGKAGAGKETVRELPEVSAEGYPIISFADWKKGEPGNIIIIAAPFEAVTEETSAAWCNHPLVIDIAQGRKGVSEGAAASGKFRLIKAPGLPALASPVSAGNMLAEFIISDRKNL